jgi:hypothetical protein
MGGFYHPSVEKTQMKFYTKNHRYYGGIDLHTKNLSVCLLNQKGTSVVHKNIKAKPQALMSLIKPFLEDRVIGVEGLFSWYWVATFGGDHSIKFVLGHLPARDPWGQSQERQDRLP